MNNLQIPSGWHKQTLGRIASIRIGKTPPRDHDEFWDVHKQSQNVWLSIRDMTSRYLSDSAEYITDKAIREFNIPAVEMGTILLSFKLTIGKVAIAQRELRTNEAIAAIKILDSDQTDNDFLSYGLSHWNLLQNVDQAIKGATLNKKKLREIEFTLPIDPAEQRAIADILSIVDEAIAQSESLVRKYQSIKQGLMSDLLTRGVDEDGELRPTREEAPGLYRESSLGWLPKDWEGCTLFEVVPGVEYGTSVSLKDEPDGIPVLRMNNLAGGEFDLSELRYSKNLDAYRYKLKYNDVLFNRTNSLEHVGRTSIWKGEIEEVSFASYLVRLFPDTTKILPDYLNFWMNLPESQLAIRRYATPGVHQVNINPTNLRKTNISLPQKLSEQEKIIDIIYDQKQALKTEIATLGKLKLLKQGLMQDLLSGQVRVKMT